MKPKMKPKFNLREKLRCTLKFKPNNKIESVLARKHTNEKNEQIEDAVQYCLENKVRGHVALKSGYFPLIKDRETINRRLDGEIKTG